jgi:hypothetical protein
MNALRHGLARALDDATWSRDRRWRRVGIGLLVLVVAGWLVVFDGVLDTARANGEVVRAAQLQPR